jgi:transmembrane sensor
MKWLDSPQDEAERLIREGLDGAAQRTGDEITHRRVWAKVAEEVDSPRPRIVGRFLLVGSALVLVFAAGALAYSYLPRHAEVATAPAPAAPPSASQPTTPIEAKPVVAESQNKAIDEVPISEAERAPGHVVRTRVGERARVGLGGGAVADLDENSAITWDSQHRPSVERGTAHLSVPHQPPGWRFSVTAGPYVVTVVGTKFDVRLANHTVEVDVSEGIVEVWRGSHSTRLAAGDSWHGPLNPEDPQPRVAPAPLAFEEKKGEPAQSTFDKGESKLEPHASHGVQEAQAALRAGDTQRALDILTRAAQGSGPAAENAAYALGHMMRYNLDHPRQAVALWDKYRTRFPSGLLRIEADLSIVETLAQVGDARAALSEADAFVARYPNSERRLDVQRLAERLRASQAASNPR